MATQTETTVAYGAGILQLAVVGSGPGPTTLHPQAG